MKLGKLSKNSTQDPVPMAIFTKALDEAGMRDEIGKVNQNG